MADLSDAGPAGLERELVELGRVLAVPDASPGFAAAVRQRVAAVPPAQRSRPGGGDWLRPRPWRRSALAAAALLLVLAAVAAAIGLGVPGIRILFGDGASTAGPATSPPPSTPGSALGARLGIGVEVDADEAERLAGFRPRLPAALRAPEGIHTSDGRITLVWSTDADLPPLRTARDIGLLVTEFRGAVDPGWYEKVVSERRNTVEAVAVGDHDGFWITGDPHLLVYRDGRGRFVEETRRMVGDVLIWSDGDLTYRLETSLGRDAAVELATTIR